MNTQDLFDRYRSLQRYVGWNEEDVLRMQTIRRLVVPHIPTLVDDFYAEIERHPLAQRVITGGDVQINRLKGTLRTWLEQLLAGPYDEAYVTRRWQVGLRHVEIGLDQVYTNAALSRMRCAMVRILGERWEAQPALLVSAIGSLLRLIDLDLAIIEDAYQQAHVQKQKRLDRLVAMGQMAAGIAHEMRNPLNVIQSSVYYLRNAAQLTPEKQGQHLERIQRQVTIAESVVGAMYDFAKMPIPELLPVPIRALLDESLLNHEVAKRLQASVVCDPEDLVACGDRRQLLIVLGNLVRNALEAMPHGGELRLRAVREKDWVVIAVEDNGVGMNAAQLHRIFEPFHSEKARGLGLGLAICRSIVENHQGQISVTSTPGAGSQFVLRLLAKSN